MSSNICPAVQFRVSRASERRLFIYPRPKRTDCGDTLSLDDEIYARNRCNRWATVHTFGWLNTSGCDPGIIGKGTHLDYSSGCSSSSFASFLSLTIVVFSVRSGRDSANEINATLSP